jgi:hypothetical protein
VREAYEEHMQIKTLLQKIAGINQSDDNYNMKLRVLKEDVEHHVKDEEEEMLDNRNARVRPPPSSAYFLEALMVRIVSRDQLDDRAYTAHGLEACTFKLDRCPDAVIAP